MHIKYILQISLLSTFLLAGCQSKPVDYAYLMTHPDLLARSLGRCQASEPGDPQCDVIKQAAGDFTQLVDERSAGPEKFGTKILQAEMELATLKEALGAPNMDAAQLVEAKKAYDAQYQKVNVLLAVVSATSLQ